MPPITGNVRDIGTGDVDGAGTDGHVISVLEDASSAWTRPPE